MKTSEGIGAPEETRIQHTTYCVVGLLYSNAVDKHSKRVDVPNLSTVISRWQLQQYSWSSALPSKVGLSKQ